MPWTVVVDFDLCASNAVCVGIAPDIFVMSDDGSLAILDFEATDEDASAGGGDGAHVPHAGDSHPRGVNAQRSGDVRG